MNALFLKVLSGISAAAIGVSSFTGAGPINQNMQMSQNNTRQQGQMMGQRGQNSMGNMPSGSRNDNAFQNNDRNNRNDTTWTIPQQDQRNNSESSQRTQAPQNNDFDRFGINQPQKLIKEGFIDNGTINRELPEVTGNTDNPKPDNDLIEEITTEDGLTQSDDYSYVYLLGDVSDSEYESLKTYIDVAYEDCSWIVDSLASNGWEIILTSADLDRLLFDGSTNGVTGATVFADKTIYIEAGEYEYCVVHEIGHYLDYTNSFISTQSEFTQIFNEEGSNLSEYGSTDRLEFFAEVFMYGILEEDTTASKVPQAYEFIENLKSAS